MNIFETQQRSRQWTEEERLVLDQVRRLSRDLIAPKAEHYDQTGEFPWENIRALNELGANTMFVPEAFGGVPISEIRAREASPICKVGSIEPDGI